MRIATVKMVKETRSFIPNQPFNEMLWGSHQANFKTQHRGLTSWVG